MANQFFRCAAAVASLALAGTLVAQTTITIHRDAVGTPHVFATSDRGALYGAGYAQAQDRLFQMHLLRLRYQGRLAEYLGAGTGNANVQADRYMRTLGFARTAVAQVAQMTPQERRLLQHYCDGVNAWMATPGIPLDPNFQALGLPLTPWAPEDCLGVWYVLANAFQGQGLAESQLRHQYDGYLAQMPPLTEPEIAGKFFSKSYCDDAIAAVQQSDVPAATRTAMTQFAQQYGIRPDATCTLGAFVPHFSEFFAVAGWRTNTGTAHLAGLPRVPVSLPNPFHELHMQGATFTVRGAMFPGAPFVLAGFNQNVAWSVTKLNADQSDLFRLATDPAHPDQYRLNGVWLGWDVDATETVLVKNGAPSSVRYRSTYWGPVVTEFASDVQAGEEYALKAVPFAEPARNMFTASLAMYRAGTATTFFDALERWDYPCVNLDFAVTGGSIGYAALGRLPVRRANQFLPGAFALDGDTTANDWQGYVPHNLRPWVIDPASGQVLSGNHLPIGSWYPMKSLFPICGDTNRAYVIRGALNGQATWTTDQLRTLAESTVNAYARDITRLAIQLVDVQGAVLTSDASKSLQPLRRWLANGATMTPTTAGVVIAHFMPTAINKDPADPAAAAILAVIDAYGRGEPGMSLFLREVQRGLTLTPPRPIDANEALVLQYLLEQAWKRFQAAPSSPSAQPTAQWAPWYTSTVMTYSLPLWGSMFWPEPLNPGSLLVGPMRCANAHALLDLPDAALDMFVNVNGSDQGLSRLALGENERATSPDYLSQKQLWEQGSWKAAPLQLTTLQALGITSTVNLTIP